MDPDGRRRGLTSRRARRTRSVHGRSGITTSTGGMHVFVRWKRKEAFHHSVDYDGTYYTEMACLVRSERTPEGPTQLVVCYLGGIRCYLDHRAWEELKIGWYTKHEFWGQTLAALD